jgi:hypothetical protein
MAVYQCGCTALALRASEKRLQSCLRFMYILRSPCSALLLESTTADSNRQKRHNVEILSMTSYSNKRSLVRSRSFDVAISWVYSSVHLRPYNRLKIRNLCRASMNDARTWARMYTTEHYRTLSKTIRPYERPRQTISRYTAVEDDR